MADQSKIEWTDMTWNPIVGCSLKSPGCTNCYAMPMARRLAAMGSVPQYDGLTETVNGKAVWTGEVRLVEHMLDRPLRTKRPSRVFVNSMGDLFHEDVPDEWIDQVFAVMALAWQHRFQVLTKRADRMRSYMDACLARIYDKLTRFTEYFPESLHRRILGRRWGSSPWPPWPLRNVWLGVSAENQATAEERIPLLLRTNAAVRFLSAEPLLGPIDLSPLRITDFLHGIDRPASLYALRGAAAYQIPDSHWTQAFTKLDWVIAGGESGPGARPMRLEWMREIAGQCKSNGIPLFVKQLGTDPRVYKHEIKVRLLDRRGGDWLEWPRDLRVREYPNA